MKEVKIGMGRRRVRFMEKGIKWRLPGLLYANHLVLCGEFWDVFWTNKVQMEQYVVGKWEGGGRFH